MIKVLIGGVGAMQCVRLASVHYLDHDSLWSFELKKITDAPGLHG